MTKLEASTRCFIEAWSFICTRLPRGEVHQLPGFVAAFGRVPVPFFNLCLLDSPVESEVDLEMRVQGAVRFAAQADVPWLLALCDEWLPASADDICRNHGLEPKLTLVAMAAENLAVPRRPLPELRYERAVRQELYDLMAQINCRAYGMSEEMGRSLSVASLWDASTYPVIGFLEAEPVTCSATIPVGGILYVGWVATIPEHQRKGYAEAVMRKSLEIASADSGFSTTWLHATEAGFPVYSAMGYEPTARFTLYSAPAAAETASSG